MEIALYTTGKVIDSSQVKVARFERSGDISVIPREKQKKVSVTEITVREGVHTFFVGRDAEHDEAELAGTKQLTALRDEITALREEISTMLRRPGGLRRIPVA